MPERFDPYHTWLGISPEEQPPNHYRLLGIPLFEDELAVIETAADRQMVHLRSFQTGKYSELSQRLLNEVAAAKVQLMNPARKTAYDRNLRGMLRAAAKGPEEVERWHCRQFLALLQEKNLLPAKLLKSLSKQVTGAEQLVSAATVSKRLVDAGYLAPELAERLLAALARDMPKLTTAARKGSLFDEERSVLAGGVEARAGIGPLDKLAAGAEVEAAAGPLAGARRKGLRALFSRKRKIGRKTSQWDSALILVGGGTLLALLIALPVLIWALSRQSGDEALAQATEQYHAGSYTTAISNYNEYLKRFPNHSGVSIARVNRGLARLRQVTPKGTRDWTAALKTAKEVLAEIAPEKEFNKAHGDLAAMLLAIAEGLAAQAREKPSQTLVDQTNEAVGLMEKYVPKSLRRGDKIAEIQASLTLSVREIACDQELAKTLAQMSKAVAAGDTRQAYQAYNQLVKQYPRLVDNDQLRHAVLEVSRAQREAVTVVTKEQPAEPAGATEGSAAGPVQSAVVLAQCTTRAKVPGVEGQVVFALADGAAYGLDAGTGKVLWRRFLGAGGNGRSVGFPPTPVSQTPGSDVLLVHPLRSEVLLVEAASGRLRWRHAIGERFDAHPVIAAAKVLVATGSGRLVTIDISSGSSPGYVQLPQPLLVAPAVDAQRSLIFQVADHSNLFVLGLGDGKCRAVVYLGHERGTVAAPPVVVGRFLLVAVNDRAKTSSLHVLSIEQKQEEVSLKPVQQLRLSGYVDTMPLASGGRVLVATDSGVVSVLELSGDASKNPLRVVAETPPAEQDNLIRFALMRGGNFWIADAQLTKYEIQAASSQLVPKWVADQGSVFQQPLATIGEAIYSVRCQVGMPGTLVAATRMDEPEHFWETRLATPLVGEVEHSAFSIQDSDEAGGRITAVTCCGGLFQVDTGGLGAATVVQQPVATLDQAGLRRPVTDVCRLGDGLLAVAAGGGCDWVAVVDPAQPQSQFRRLSLPDRLSCPPIGFAGGLLAPCKVGQVFLLDPRSGAEQVEPFQPLLTGTELTWRRPAVIGSAGGSAGQLVLADGLGKLYRVGVLNQAKPHLAALDEVQLSQPIVSPLAASDKVVCAVDAAGALCVFALPKLTPIEAARQVLSAGCNWGPQRVGNCIVLSTEDDQLLCLDDTGKLLWQAKLPYGPLAGTPRWDDGRLLMASASGVVRRVDVATGQELGKIETGLPLGTGPLLLGEQLVLGGHDGTLYVVATRGSGMGVGK